MKQELVLYQQEDYFCGWMQNLFISYVFFGVGGSDILGKVNKVSL